MPTLEQIVEQQGREINWLKRRLSAMGEGDELLTIEEVCAWLKVEAGTVYNWSSTRLVRTAKLGGLKFYKSSIEQLLAKNTRLSKADLKQKAKSK